MDDAPKKGILGAILFAGVVTLLVTLLRLYGERQDWNPTFFSREAGGHGALVGISWLVIPFGFWFGRRLARDHGRPVIRRALLLNLLAIVLFVAGMITVTQVWPKDMKAMAAWLGYGTPVLALLCLPAWPRAFAANLLYGVVARVPVIAVQYIAVANNWGTHYDTVRGEMGEQPPEVRAHMLMLAQATFWTPYTVMVGGLFAVLGALSVRNRT